MAAKLVVVASALVLAAGVVGCAGESAPPLASDPSNLTSADSVYTDLGDSCQVIESSEAFTRSACRSVGPYRFILEQGDLRFNAVIGTENGDADLDLWSSSLVDWPAPKMFGGFQDLGPKVEWRVPANAPNEAPYALIFRITENEGQNQFLVVAKLGIDPDNAWPCLYRIVDGRAADANVLARQAADEARTGTCPTR